MAPEDRRAAILDATVPLLAERGGGVTTRQLAEAAGVAEGTLFRVFPDKESLVLAAVVRALDPAPVVESLRSLGPPLEVREAVRQAVRIVHARAREVVVLLTVAHEVTRSRPGVHPHPPGRKGSHLEAIVEALASALEPYRDRLTQPPAQCARMLLGSVLGATGPFGGLGGGRLEPDELARVLCDGLVGGGTQC